MMLLTGVVCFTLGYVLCALFIGVRGCPNPECPYHHNELDEY